MPRLPPSLPLLLREEDPFQAANPCIFTRATSSRGIPRKKGRLPFETEKKKVFSARFVSLGETRSLDESYELLLRSLLRLPLLFVSIYRERIDQPR